ncbi:MAG: hypothetical protein AAGD11_17890 [Planctomycetota bacterium]
MSKSPQQHPMGAAMQWVARIIAAGMMMVLPGLAGQWLDGRLGAGFFALLGFALGIFVSMSYLIAVTQTDAKKKN